MSMGKEIGIELENEAYNKLAKMADDLGLNIKRMCKHILEEFTYQGKVYVGLWEEGPGKRIIIDFPKYTSRVVKVRSTELK